MRFSRRAKTRTTVWALSCSYEPLVRGGKSYHHELVSPLPSAYGVDEVRDAPLEILDDMPEMRAALEAWGEQQGLPPQHILTFHTLLYVVRDPEDLRRVGVVMKEEGYLHMAAMWPIQTLSDEDLESAFPELVSYRFTLTDTEGERAQTEQRAEEWAQEMARQFLPSGARDMISVSARLVSEEFERGQAEQELVAAATHYMRVTGYLGIPGSERINLEEELFNVKVYVETAFDVLDTTVTVGGEAVETDEAVNFSAYVTIDLNNPDTTYEAVAQAMRAAEAACEEVGYSAEGEVTVRPQDDGEDELHDPLLD